MENNTKNTNNVNNTKIIVDKLTDKIQLEHLTNLECFKTYNGLVNLNYQLQYLINTCMLNVQLDDNFCALPALWELTSFLSLMISNTISYSEEEERK